MKDIIANLKNRNETIAFMESCTGGLLANLITNTTSASDVLKVSLVTYSNEYKIKFGINPNTIEEKTVYSEEVAKEMSKKITEFANSDWGVGVTGKLEELNQQDNRVYFSIYNKNNDNYFSQCVMVKGNSRREMKEQISEIIFKKILELVMN